MHAEMLKKRALIKARRELRPTKGKVSKPFHQNGSQSVTM